jgi:hypothetical protein
VLNEGLPIVMKNDGKLLLIVSVGPATMTGERTEFEIAYLRV